MLNLTPYLLYANDSAGKPAFTGRVVLAEVSLFGRVFRLSRKLAS